MDNERQELRYLIGSIKRALQAFPGDSMFDTLSVGLRYGTIRDLLAILLNDSETRLNEIQPETTIADMDGCPCEEEHHGMGR